MIKKPANQQHHGNLREALVLAGLELLEEGGLPALTLRKCAARAGVSHAAPAHHFDGLRGLKTAIAIRGFGVFEQMMKDAMAEANPETKSQVLGICQGYIRFATEHNALFRLVFDERDELMDDPDWQAASDSARKVLNDLCQKLESGPGGQAALQTALYSLVHGYSKLMEIKSIRPGSGGERDVKFEDVLEYFVFKPKPDGTVA